MVLEFAEKNKINEFMYMKSNKFFNPLNKGLRLKVIIVS